MNESGLTSYEEMLWEFLGMEQLLNREMEQKMLNEDPGYQEYLDKEDAISQALLEERDE